MVRQSPRLSNGLQRKGDWYTETDVIMKEKNNRNGLGIDINTMIKLANIARNGARGYRLCDQRAPFN